MVMAIMTKAGIWTNKKDICTDLVKQDDDYGCAIAALSMVLGVTYAKMRREVQEYWDAFFPFHPYRGMDDADENIILYKHGFKTYTIQVPPDEDGEAKSFKDLIAGERALMSVPSINFPGLYHALFFDGTRLHDPSKLKK